MKKVKLTIIALVFFACLHGQSGINFSGVGPKVLSPQAASNVLGLMNFDGANDYISLSADLDTDIEGSKTITFNCYLLTNADNGFYTIFAFKSTDVDDYLALIYSPGQQLLGTRVTQTSGGGRQYDISAYHDQALACEIIKTDGGITSLKLNGVTITPTFNLSLTAPASSNIGFYDGQAQYGKFMTLWNLVIATTGGADLHEWIGYPAGNTDAAWADQVGSINGTVNGSPTIFTSW